MLAKAVESQIINVLRQQLLRGAIADGAPGDRLPIESKGNFHDFAI
jgi:hypothetical protein